MPRFQNLDNSQLHVYISIIELTLIKYKFIMFYFSAKAADLDSCASHTIHSTLCNLFVSNHCRNQLEYLEYYNYSYRQNKDMCSFI
jgi:hypothetical protein